MLTKLRLINRLAIVLLVLLWSQAVLANQSSIVDIAKKIVKDVGTIGTVYSEGKKGSVFVFEEYHTSRVGRLQIAVMLNRLHRDHNLKIIGLEGAIQSSRSISGEWFHKLGGDKAKLIRENIAVRMLTEGEINSAELMELAHPDMEVYGIELKSEYDVTLDAEGNPRIMYLIAIAEKYSFSQKQIKEINSFIKQEKVMEAIEYMLNADPWTKKYYEAIKSTSPTSTKEIVKQIDEILQKARELNVQVDPKIEKNMQKTRNFFEVASRRSSTMVEYVVENLFDKASKHPVAMIIGAAHTPEVIDELKAHGVSCAQITPLDLNPDYGTLSMEQFDLKNQGKWAQTSPGTLGSLLNSRRNPPPIIETTSAQSYASACYASILLAEFVHSGGSIPPIPDDLKAQLESLQEYQMRIDLDSITPDGDDVIFRMWLKNTANEEVEVWARIGRSDTSGQDQTLEEKLLREISGIKETAEKGDDRSDTPEEEGLKRMTLDSETKAVFSENRDKVVRHGQISG